jgi:branched-chain amino acid transport system permease protein
MVYGVLRLINFAHGDVYMLGAYIGLFLARWTGAFTLAQNNHPVPVAMTVFIFVGAMVGSALVGLVIERIAYRPLRNAPRLTALITAIGVSLLLEYGGQMVFSASPQGFPELLPTRDLLPDSGVAITVTKVFIVLSAFVLMLGLQLLIKKTKVGRAMRAVSIDRAAASLMGINTDHIITLTFAIGGALAAAAGVLQALDQPTIDPLIGINVGLKAFIAAVLGGIGNIPGAMVGGLLMAFAETAAVMAGYSAYKDAVAFAILSIVLIVRPAGLFGANTAEKV